MQPVLSLRNLSKSFGKKKILDNISFDIYTNEIFGIIGRSGSGKSTLLRTIIGFYRPDQGAIYCYGQNMVDNTDIAKMKFGFSTQDDCFYQDLTLIENLRYFGRLYKIKEKEISQRSEYFLKLVELWEHKDTVARNLSGGMQRRLDLCCAMLHMPKVLLLDEPTNGLDPILRKNMWAIIRKINESGVTVIISTHMLEELERICTNVAMIRDGKLFGIGSPDKLKEFYSKSEEVRIESRPGNYKLIVKKLQEKGLNINHVNYDDKPKLIIYTSTGEAVLHELIHVLEEFGEKLVDAAVNKPTLSEVFEAFSNIKGR